MKTQKLKSSPISRASPGAEAVATRSKMADEATSQPYCTEAHFSERFRYIGHNTSSIVFVMATHSRGNPPVTYDHTLAIGGVSTGSCGSEERHRSGTHQAQAFAPVTEREGTVAADIWERGEDRILARFRMSSIRASKQKVVQTLM